MSYGIYSIAAAQKEQDDPTGRPVLFYSERDSNRRSERQENVPVARF